MTSHHTTFLLRLYRAFMHALRPLLPIWLSRRARIGKEDPKRLNERYGISSLPRPNGPLIWLHGASVGECMMLLPLIDALTSRRANCQILLTSGTVTAAKLMAARLPKGTCHQYVPLDSPKYVRHFLDHWQPRLAIWAESEIWPNLIFETKARGTKLALINARMSLKSLAGWRKRSASAKAVFSKFDLILSADKLTADGLSEFTMRTIDMVGNLKDAAEPLPANAAKLKELTEAIGKRKLWCAASTHTGEDLHVIEAHQQILDNHPDALLILAPRHPERSDDIVELINSRGLSFATRSSGQKPDTKTHIYVFDSIGEMGLIYRLAPITLMCGSLIEGLSGHNPLEPARLGSAVLSGPYVSSFEDIYADMDALITVTTDQDIARKISHFLSDATALAAAQKSARDFCGARADVLARVWEALAPLMPAEEAQS